LNKKLGLAVRPPVSYARDKASGFQAVAESLKDVWDRLVPAQQNVALFVLKQQRRGSGRHTAADSELLFHHS